jgi:hypothetical protein
MALVLNGSGTIAGLSAGGISDAGAIADAAMGAGAVLQVVQATTTTSFSTTSTSFVDSGFSASITPTSASSKVLVMFNGRLYVNAAGAEGAISIYRSGTPIWTGYTVFNSGAHIATHQSAVFLDSPATTSATTYALYMRASGGGFSLLPNGTNDGIATITLMEIAA